MNFSSPVIRIELRTSKAKWLFLASLAAPLLAYSLLIGRIYVAAHAAQQPDLPHLQTAVRLQPGNAEYWDGLGRYYVLAASDADTSIAQYLKAVSVNPRVSQYWLDLAFAYKVNEDTAKERDALDHAIAVDPEQPAVAWQAAVHYAVGDDFHQARRNLRTVIERDVTRREMAFDLAYRITPDVGTLIAEVLPAVPERHLDFAYYLVAHDHPEQVGALWDHLATMHPRFTAERCVPLITFMADHGQTAAAVRAWKSLSDIVPGFQAYEWEPNLLVNGGFEEDLLNGGFDWRIDHREHVTLEQDTTTFHGGTRSILATFDGRGDGNVGLLQTVPVEPATQYVLKGFLRGEELDSAFGPRLIVSNRKSYAILATSNPLDSNSAWHPVEVEFSSPAGADQVIVSIGQGAQTGIMKGKLWIDDLQLQKK